MKRTLGFIGAGNMASSIISGVAGGEASGVEQVLVYDLDAAKPQRLAGKFSLVRACAGAQEVVSRADVLVLAVKPQNFEQVLAEIAPAVNREAVVVSIAAGIPASYIKSQLGFDAKVVLVMPNTPLMLREGATALSRVAPTGEEEFQFVKGLFAQSGVACEIDPGQMNEIIAVNGSTPAFIYLFAKGFLAYAKREGIDDQAALALFSQTLIGSAKMLTDSGLSVDELIKMVSSPGGTTLAGLQAFYDHGFEGEILDACERCVKRAYELSK